MKKKALFAFGIAVGMACLKVFEKLEEWDVISIDMLDPLDDDHADYDERC